MLNAQMHDGLDGQTQNLMIPDCGDLSYNDLILLGIVYGPLNPNEKSQEQLPPDWLSLNEKFMQGEVLFPDTYITSNNSFGYKYPKDTSGLTNEMQDAIKEGYNILDTKLYRETGLFNQTFQQYTRYYYDDMNFESSKKNMETQFKNTTFIKKFINIIPTAMELAIILYSKDKTKAEKIFESAESLLSPETGDLITYEPEMIETATYITNEKIMSFHNNNPEYKYLINNNSRRDDFINCLKKTKNDLDDKKLTQTEVDVVGNMIDDVIQINQNYEEYEKCYNYSIYKIKASVNKWEVKYHENQ